MTVKYIKYGGTIELVPGWDTNVNAKPPKPAKGNAKPTPDYINMYDFNTATGRKPGYQNASTQRGAKIAKVQKKPIKAQAGKKGS